MKYRIAGVLSALRHQCRGNATMMVAMGMPALIGTSGLAVDVAQWYVWKRDLQYAVDQAAIAGAYASAGSATAAFYKERAAQEFSANMGVVKDIATTPSVELANYAGGTDNSVIVRSSATKRLPFSSFLTGQSTTVVASAQASFKAGAKFTSCIIAVDEEAEGAITIGGSVKLAARCGIAALSRSPDAVVIDGNPEVDPGWVVAAGGIDAWLAENTDAEIHEYVDDLIDPFAELVAPDNPTSQTYSKQENCKVNSSFRATGTQKVTVTTKIYKGNKKAEVALVSTETEGPNTYVVDRPAYKNEVNDYSTSTNTQESWQDSGAKVNPRYTLTQTLTTTENNITIVADSNNANSTLQPGTYSDLTFGCDAVLAPGIYVVDGGSFNVGAQYSVIGNGVMIVLKNGAQLNINGGAGVNLTAMTADQLVSAYSNPPIDAEAASALEGMLVFERRDSVPEHSHVLNGNAGMVLNGTVYMPNGDLQFTGTVGVTSQCLMLAANTITLLGNVNMSTFCPGNQNNDELVTLGKPQVKLVS